MAHTVSQVQLLFIYLFFKKTFCRLKSTTKIMCSSRSSKIGYLVPLKANSGEEEEDSSIPKLPLFRGPNTIGRHNFSVPDKRISRNHLILTASGNPASVNLTVEGTNPVVVKSGGERKKLSHGEEARIASGDIIELIPGHHFYKFLPLLASRYTQKRASSNAGIHVNENDQISGKKFRGESEDNASVSGAFKATGGAKARDDNEEAIRNFRIPDEKLPSTFRLLRVKELPHWANTSCVSINDVIQGDILVALLSNYMVDIDWLMSACPALAKVPHVMVIHGEGDGTLEHMKRNKPGNWILHKPPLPISFGTHHSKAMLLVYPRGVRIIVHTANLIYVDWNNKSQGLWVQDFPWKEEKNLTTSCGFENDLVDYLNALKFSSLGSLDEKWMTEFATSMSSGLSEDKMPLGLGEPQIIWPTVEDVRCSLEGYAAGNAIPSPLKNVEKGFLKKYWAKWEATHTGRSRAMPHIKTFTRYNGQKLAWFLLTSANLSKAAWGALQKNNSQLMIRSYELGVLFLPCKKKIHGGPFSCTGYGGPWKLEDEGGTSTHSEGSKTKLVTLIWKGDTGSFSDVIPLPVPYELPPPQYNGEDIPWSWDRRYSKKDVYGQVWPRVVQLYSCQS